MCLSPLLGISTFFVIFAWSSHDFDVPLQRLRQINIINKTTMKKIIFGIALLLSSSLAMVAQENKKACCKTLSSCSKNAKGYYTQYYGNNPQLIKEAEAWAASGAWQNGFTKARPHHSVNLVDFYLQYQKNPEQWKALFDYLAKTDLLSIPGGKHKIPGSSLTISVEDSKNDPLEKRGSESHNHHIDFQYVVKGVERFGIIDHYTSTPNCKYRPDVIHYDYKKCRTKFYDSTPDEFFIFFPRDWHIAKVANDTDNQDIRVLVIKVDYKD